MFLQVERNGMGGKGWESWLLGTARGCPHFGPGSQILGRAHGPYGCSLASLGGVLGPDGISSSDHWRDSRTLSWPFAQALHALVGAAGVSERWDVALGSGEESAQNNWATSCGDACMDLATGEPLRFLPGLRNCDLGGRVTPPLWAVADSSCWARDRPLTDVRQSPAGANSQIRFRPCLVIKIIFWTDRRKSAL